MPFLQYHDDEIQKNGCHAVTFEGRQTDIKVVDPEEGDQDNTIRFSFLNNDQQMVKRCTGRVFPDRHQIDFVEGWNWDYKLFPIVLYHEPQPI